MLLCLCPREQDTHLIIQSDWNPSVCSKLVTHFFCIINTSSHCFTNNNDYPFQRLTYWGTDDGCAFLCFFSLRLLGLPAEEQSAGYNGLLPPTQSCKFSFSLSHSHSLCLPSFTHIHTNDICTVAFWLYLTSAFLTERAEHGWGWSHACSQGTWHLWITKTHRQRLSHIHTNVTQ